MRMYAGAISDYSSVVIVYDTTSIELGLISSNKSIHIILNYYYQREREREREGGRDKRRKRVNITDCDDNCGLPT